VAATGLQTGEIAAELVALNLPPGQDPIAGGDDPLKMFYRVLHAPRRKSG
jgi:hypothetical protein